MNKESEKLYRKRPVVIEAIQFTNNFHEVEKFMNQSLCCNMNGTGEPQEILIRTLEGEMTARKNDWIIKGVNGEFYPCKPDIFEKTYESASIPSREEAVKVNTEKMYRLVSGTVYPKEDGWYVCKLIATGAVTRVLFDETYWDTSYKPDMFEYFEEIPSQKVNTVEDMLRPVVKWFAEKMEDKLKANDHKTGWINDDWDELYDRLLEESKELYRECGKFTKDESKIIGEAADVANFAMMIADRLCKQIGQNKKPQFLSSLNTKEEGGEKDAEIARLKGLIKGAFKAGWQGGESYHGESKEDDENAYNELLQEFKSENNI